MAYRGVGEHISIRVCDRQQEDIQGIQKGSDGWISSIIRSKLSRHIEVSVWQTRKHTAKYYGTVVLCFGFFVFFCFIVFPNMN